MEKLIEFVPASSMRPGFAFSLALSQFKRNERRAALILYNPNECTHSVEASMESLVQAVLMYPLAIQRLSNKLKKNGTRLNPSYETVLKNPFFARANDGDSQSLSHLVNLNSKHCIFDVFRSTCSSKEIISFTRHKRFWIGFCWVVKKLCKLSIKQRRYKD